MELDYGLFMAESAGLLNTKESRLNKVCKELSGIHAGNDFDKGAIEIIVEQVLRKNKLSWCELTYSEQRRVLGHLK